MIIWGFDDLKYIIKLTFECIKNKTKIEEWPSQILDLSGRCHGWLDLKTINVSLIKSEKKFLRNDGC